MLANWKTTAAGAATIATALGIILHMAATGMWDAPTLGATIMGVATGLGLVAAKDGNVTGGTVKQ